MRTVKSLFMSVMLSALLCSCSGAGDAPLIGVSCGRSSSGAANVSSNYTNAIVRAGGIPVILPIIDEPGMAESLIGRLDGVMFTGGADLDPAEYGEPVLNETVEIDSVRDRSDLLLARAAVASGKPVLAICRGEQLLNVVLGGTLYQDLPAQVPGVHAHRDTSHRIGVEKGSVLFELFGKDSLTVNSSHHQAVKDIAPGSRVTAVSDDGIVEAYENGNILAVQFHPERMVLNEPEWYALFKCFVDRARK